MTPIKNYPAQLLNDILYESGSELNKGLDPYTLLVSPALEQLGKDELSDEDSDAGMEMESRVFTFFTSVTDAVMLDDQEKMTRFLRRVILLELAILRHYSGDTALNGIGEVLVGYTSTRPINVTDEDGFAVFESDDADYRMRIKVNNSTGYREARIDNKLFFTKSGSLTMSDIAILIKVLNLLV